MTKVTTLNRHLEKQIKDTFCQVLAETDDPKRIEELLSDLTTSAEFLDLSRRLTVAVYLDKNRSYENISQNLGVSAGNIAAVAKKRDGRGLSWAVRLIDAEAWAESWGTQISRVLKKILSL